MGTSVYTSLLIKDYKRKLGNIKAIRKDLSDLAKIVLDMERDVTALLTVIQSREPDFTASSVKAIATVPKVLGLPWNKLSILTIEAMKFSDVHPVHAHDITNYVISHGQINIQNRRAYTTVYYCVRACLKRLKIRGKVIRCYENTKETEGLWDLGSSE